MPNKNNNFMDEWCDRWPNDERCSSYTKPTPPTPIKPRPEMETRLVGSVDVDHERPHKYPFMVSVQTREFHGHGLEPDIWTHQCGGSLIEWLDEPDRPAQWVLTSAHCVHNKYAVGELSVVLGGHQFNIEPISPSLAEIEEFPFLNYTIDDSNPWSSNGGGVRMKIGSFNGISYGNLNRTWMPGYKQHKFLNHNGKIIKEGGMCGTINDFALLKLQDPITNPHEIQAHPIKLLEDAHDDLAHYPHTPTALGWGFVEKQPQTAYCHEHCHNHDHRHKGNNHMSASDVRWTEDEIKNKVDEPYKKCYNTCMQYQALDLKPNTLQEVQLPIVDGNCTATQTYTKNSNKHSTIKICEDDWLGDGSYHICAGDDQSGVCLQDSGGPLFSCYGGGNDCAPHQYQLLGVATAANTTSKFNYPFHDYIHRWGEAWSWLKVFINPNGFQWAFAEEMTEYYLGKLACWCRTETCCKETTVVGSVLENNMCHWDDTPGDCYLSPGRCCKALPEFWPIKDNYCVNPEWPVLFTKITPEVKDWIREVQKSNAPVGYGSTTYPHHGHYTYRTCTNHDMCGVYYYCHSGIDENGNYNDDRYCVWSGGTSPSKHGIPDWAMNSKSCIGAGSYFCGQGDLCDDDIDCFGNSICIEDVNVCAEIHGVESQDYFPEYQTPPKCCFDVTAGTGFNDWGDYEAGGECA